MGAEGHSSTPARRYVWREKLHGGVEHCFEQGSVSSLCGLWPIARTDGESTNYDSCFAPASDYAEGCELCHRALRRALKRELGR